MVQAFDEMRAALLESGIAEELVLEVGAVQTPFRAPFLEPLQGFSVGKLQFERPMPEIRADHALLVEASAKSGDVVIRDPEGAPRRYAIVDVPTSPDAAGLVRVQLRELPA